MKRKNERKSRVVVPLEAGRELGRSRYCGASDRSRIVTPGLGGSARAM